MVYICIDYQSVVYYLFFLLACFGFFLYLCNGFVM